MFRMMSLLRSKNPPQISPSGNKHKYLLAKQFNKEISLEVIHEQFSETHLYISDVQLGPPSLLNYPHKLRESGQATVRELEGKEISQRAERDLMGTCPVEICATTKCIVGSGFFVGTSSTIVSATFDAFPSHILVPKDLIVASPITPSSCGLSLCSCLIASA